MPQFYKLVDDATQQLSTPYKTIPVLAPVSGRVSSLDVLPLGLFQQRIFGEGICIEASGFQLIAPFSGVVAEITASCEQLRLQCQNGLLMMFQLGMGADQFHGMGFKSSLKRGHKVSRGQTLIEFDLRKIKQQGGSNRFIMTVMNSHKLKGLQPHNHAVIAGEDNAMTLFI